MRTLDIAALAERYKRDGFVSPVRLVSEEDAARHRASLEAAEAKIGNLHYRSQMHTILTSAWQLATLPHVLDLVESLIGPDILLYNTTYIIKEANTPSFVSWHQDLTYWGLSHDDQVSMWLALSEADETAGCMRMIPGSHTRGRQEHRNTEDASNVLFNGQTVAGVNEASAVACPLRPGEASFHHGWTLHASMPNTGNDRRIGINMQYLAAHVRQTKHDHDRAILVRGEDRYQHFVPVDATVEDLDPRALARQAELEALHREIAADPV